MKQQWHKYADKFTQITPREQYLILLSGLFVVVMLIFNFSIDSSLSKITGQQKKNTRLVANNQSMKDSLTQLNLQLQRDPNKALQREIVEYEVKMAKVDEVLLAFTSDLINPIEMRHALIELLNVQKGVSLVSFELLGAKPLRLFSKSSVKNANNSQDSDISAATTTAKQEQSSLGLYRHGIKIKLTGKYFALRDYLAQLEGLSWTFFWQEFHYQLKQYPNSELEIEIYSLSTTKEFIGV